MRRETVEQGFAKFAKKLDAAGKQALREVAAKILVTARDNAPEDTGALRASGKLSRFRVTKTAKREKAAISIQFGGKIPSRNRSMVDWKRARTLKRVVYGDVVPHAGLIHELGGADGRGRHYLLEAIAEHIEEIRGILRQRFRPENVQRVDGKVNRMYQFDVPEEFE